MTGKRRDLPLAAELSGRLRVRMAHSAARPGRRWYRIAAQADTPDTTLVDIYDEIGWLGVTAEEFRSDLRAITTPNIELHLNSPGGDVFDGVAIYNSLRQHDAAVHVVVDSLAASAASVIAMAGDRVTAMGGSMLMIHDPWGMVIGNAVDMREMADLLDKHADNLAGIYAAHAGGPVAGWRDAMAAETWYSAEEALDAGLVDDVDQEQGRQVDNRWDLTIFAHAPLSRLPQSDIPEGEHPATQAHLRAHLEDAPERDATPDHPTSSTVSADNPRRGSGGYLGEPAWYLPSPSRREQQGCL